MKREELYVRGKETRKWGREGNRYLRCPKNAALSQKQIDFADSEQTKLGGLYHRVLHDARIVHTYPICQNNKIL